MRPLSGACGYGRLGGALSLARPPQCRKSPGVAPSARFSVMALWLQLSGLVLFLALWGAAWRRQPNLALGIFFGVAIAAVVAAFVRPSHLQSVPVWLPPLPFAAVATSLFGFGIWAWVLGRKR